MLRFAWWSLRGRWGRLLPLCCGLLCIVTCTTLLAGFTRLSTLTTDQQLRRSWRASYDLLVRSPDAISAVEQQLQVVDPAGPEQTYGGISLAQVAQIARIPRVEVAAPEAVVGWLPLRPYVPITFTHAGVYRISTHLDEPARAADEQQTFVVLPLTEYMQVAGRQATSTDGVSYVPLNASGSATVAATWSLSTLLVGIDPAAEGQLVGLHWQPSSSHAGNEVLPLLMDTHPWSSLNAMVTVETAGISPLLLSASQSTNEMLAHTSWSVIQRQQLDEASFLTLLARELGGQEQESASAPVQGGGVTRYARVGYMVTQPGSANGTAPVLSVNSTGSDVDGTLTRLPLLPQSSTPWVMLDGGQSSFATFDATTLPVWHDPASFVVPLGLYRPEPGGILVNVFPQQSIAAWPPLLFTTTQAACALTGSRCISAVRVRVSGLGSFGPRSEALLQQVASDIEERTGLHVDVLDGASARPISVQMPSNGGSAQVISALWIAPHAAVSIQKGVNVANILLLLAMIGVAALALLAAALLAASSRKADVRLLAQTGWSVGRLILEAALEATITALLALCPACAVSLLLEQFGAPPVSPALLAGLLSAGVLLYIIMYMIAIYMPISNRVRRRGHSSAVGTGGEWEQGWGPCACPRSRLTGEPGAIGRGQAPSPLARPPVPTDSSYPSLPVLASKNHNQRVGEEQTSVVAYRSKGDLHMSDIWWWMMLRRQMSWRKGSALLVMVAAAGASGLVGLLLLVQWGLDGLLAATLLGRQVEVSLSTIHLLTALLICACAGFTAGMVLLLVARERRREAGLLLAVGWTGRAVALEIVYEGLMLGVVGGCSGGVLAVLLFLILYHSESLLLFAIVIPGAASLGALLCTAGAAYPALLTARLLPKRVLSEE